MKELVLSIDGTAIPVPRGLEKASPYFSLSSIFSTGVTLLLLFAVILTLFFLISAGIDMIMAGGDKQKVVNARQKLTYAIVGLIIVFFSFFIVNVIGGLFGVNLLNVPVPPTLPDCFRKPC